MSLLSLKAWFGLVQLIVTILLCLLLPAWSLHYWEAWVYVALFAGSSVVITVYLQRYDPALLQRRVAVGPTAEKSGLQRLIQAIASVAFLGILVVPAFDHRLGWSAVPRWLVTVGEGLVLLGFAIVFATFRANTYASVTIETAKDQRVIDSGPYAVVRHPMYAGALVLLLGTPLALRSYWGLLVLLPMMAAIVWRLLDEERLLSRSLPGYTEYQARVRFRLIPGLW
jgi:protein-S-isoprenylcysteine O-methyltransferase Ste14